MVAVRPHLVWGPGDTQLVARLVDRARHGRLPLIGSGAALIDSTYVVNAVEALLAALDHCVEARGQALVVTNGEPRPVAELMAAMCRAAGAPEPTRHVPVRLARTGGALAESLWTLAEWLRPGRPADDPPLTRFLVEQMSTAHWFDQRLTRQVLQWEPRSVSTRGSPSSNAGTPFMPLSWGGSAPPAQGEGATIGRCAGSDERSPERSPARVFVRPWSMTQGGMAPMSPSHPV